MTFWSLLVTRRLPGNQRRLRSHSVLRSVITAVRYSCKQRELGILVSGPRTIKHSLTIPVSFLEASRARRLPAQAHGSRATAATVTIGVLRRVLRRHDVEGGVAGVDGVALGVHWRVTQEVIGHRRLCWKRNTLMLAFSSKRR